MKSTLLVIALGGSFAAAGLVVREAPDTVQPYVIPYLQGKAYNTGNTIIRILVTKKSSDGAFTLCNFNSQNGSVQPIHSHKQTEAFYVSKGAATFWSNSDKGRVGIQGDFHLLPAGNNHSYLPLDPDVHATQFFQPAGIEGYYAAIGVPYISSSNPPFDPNHNYPLNIAAAIALAPVYGLTLAIGATNNYNFDNGTTPDGINTWHRADTSLPGSPVPYYVANNRGPKYLQKALDQVVATLATGAETKNQANIATIAIRPIPAGSSPPAAAAYPVHQAIQVIEGQMMLAMAGETVGMLPGDTAFIPKGTRFSYWSTVGWTKVTVYANGTQSLPAALVSAGSSWPYSVWPAY